MPDNPDYSKYLPNSNRFSLQDLGELAARLGSPVIADRRGEVILLENFRHGLAGWTFQTTGAGSTGILLSSSVVHNPFSMGLKSGSVTPNTVTALKSIPAIDTKRLGFEIAFLLASNIVTFEIQFTLFIGGDGLTAQFKFDRSVNKLYILHSDFVYYEITGLPLNSVAASSLINMKFVMDIQSSKYDRLIFNATQIDISQYDLSAAGSSTDGTLYTRMSSVASQFFVGTLPIFHIIVTANEP